MSDDKVSPEVMKELNYNCPRHGLDASCTCPHSGYREALRRYGNEKSNSLLRSGLRFLAELVDKECGNAEGTPCDDSRPRYVCPQHRWLQQVREAIRLVDSTK